MRHSQPGTFAAAMREQRAWRDADELASLIDEQAAEMRRDGFAPDAVDYVDTPRPSGAPTEWITPTRPAVVRSRYPQQPPEGAYVDVDERVEWTAEARDLRAQPAWLPSLVRKEQRKHVEHALKITGDADTLRDELAAVIARKPRGGKQRTVKARKILRLRRAIAALEYEAPEREEWKPFTRDPLPKVYRPIRQSEYAETEWLRPRA